MLAKGLALPENPLNYLPTHGEILASVVDVFQGQWSSMAAGLFWFVLLAVPLVGIDRRDGITALTYTLYMTASGFIFFLALEAADSQDGFSGRHVFLLLGFAAVAGLRWILRVQKENPWPKENLP